MEDQLAGRRGRVDVLFEGPEAHARLGKMIDRRDEVFQRPAQSVKLPDGDRVTRPGAVPQPGQFGAFGFGPGNFFHVDFLTTRRRQFVGLQREVLVLDGRPLPSRLLRSQSAWFRKRVNICIVELRLENGINMRDIM